MVELETVDIEEIRRELKNLWAAEAVDNDHTIRAQTHNLIVYTEAPSSQLTATVERLIAMTIERPGRVLLVHADLNQPDLLEAAVTSYCRMVNHRQVCGEMVIFNVGAARRDELHNAVIALLMPSLPVYVWWDEPYTTDDHLAEHILPEADRILIDTSEYDSLAQLGPLRTLQHRRLSDLMWSYLTPWRRLLARLWDAGHAREALRQADELRITYAGAEGRAQAHLLAAWLASRLGWALEAAQDDGTAQVWSHPSGGSCNIGLHRVDEEVEGLHDVGIAFDSRVLGLTYTPDTSCVVVTAEQSAAARYPIGRVTRTSALTEELDAGLDPAYEDALDTLLTLLDNLE
jgi:glucose-6-phosphate dehydrogenase assembly protein OpcA